ncbi:MAG: dATP/dGTP diphosphohydrolase domain-containing protein [Thermodesulfovibrionales bacterium]
MEQGIKYDGRDGEGEMKLRWDLLPFDALEELVKVYTFGSKKYGDRNWEKGIVYSKIVGALLRHLTARLKGIIVNKEDGNVLHSAQIVWNAIALLTYDIRGMNRFDDMTPKKEKNNGRP